MPTANTTVKAVLDHLLANGGGTSKIIEEWHQGTEWYRKWSNGFIEQGGEDQFGNVNGTTVSLHTPFSSSTYIVTLGRVVGSDGRIPFVKSRAPV